MTTYVALGDSFTAGLESGEPRWADEVAKALGPRTRLIEKPYSLVLLVETLEEMLAPSQNLQS